MNSAVIVQMSSVALATSLVVVPLTVADDWKTLVSQPWTSKVGLGEILPSPTTVVVGWPVRAVSTTKTVTPAAADSPATILAREAVMGKLKKLAELPNGWLGQGSLAPSPTVLSWLAAHQEILVRGENPIALVPVADGSVELQWVNDSNEFIAEIRADDTLYLFVDRRGADSFDELTTSLSADALSAFIASGTMV